MNRRDFSLACALAPLLRSRDIGAEEPRRHTAQPNVQVLAPLRMPGLDRERTIRLYLPPGYARTRRRYPVLYMHDAQNLFDDATSFIGEWGVDEALNTLARTRHLELIVVGIDHGNDKRPQELNPWDTEKFGAGEGRQYLRFLVDVVKPCIDAHYRTLPGRTHTGIMGSSLGGLISHYAICACPQVFGKAGIFSPAYWIAPDMTAFVHRHRLSSDAQVYFYMGGKEGDEMTSGMQAMLGVVRADGIAPGNLRVSVNADAEHNERAWRAEFPAAIEWLFAR